MSTKFPYELIGTQRTKGQPAQRSIFDRDRPASGGIEGLFILLVVGTQLIMGIAFWAVVFAVALHLAGVL